MHVLLIHQAFAAIDEPGGTRHYEFARYLVSKGYRVTVITSPVSYLTGDLTLSHEQTKTRSTHTGGINILRATTYRAMHKSFLHRLLAFFSFMFSSFFTGLKVRDVDLVWGTSPPIFQGVTAWSLARIKRVPFLFEVRDLWPDFAMAVGVLSNPVLIRMSLWLERFLYRSADRVVVNSPGYVRHVESRGAQFVELIPNGADPGMFDPADKGERFRVTHNLEDKFVVLYAGAHGMSNDLGVILEAARIVRENNKHDAGAGSGQLREIQFILLGDGKEKASLVRQTEAIGLDNLMFLPPVPKNEMAEALAGADACIAILKPLDAYRLTYPNKVFDYMAAGKPVVLAIDGVIREVVEAAGCGVFAAPGDPQALAAGIIQLARDTQKARSMGLAGREYLEMHFSRDELAEKLALVLGTMI